MKKIKGIIFDLFDTLIYLDLPIYDKNREEMANILGVSKRRFEEVWRKYLNDRCSGAIPNVRKMMEILVAELGVEHSDSLLDRLEFLEKSGLVSSVRTYSDVESIIERLKRAGLKLVILSNASENASNALDVLPWCDKFDQIILSCREGMLKPDPAFYHLARERAGLRQDECIFVGDGGSMELDGARDAGLTAVKIVQSGQDPNYERTEFCHYKIGSVSELPELIDRLEAN